MIITGFIYYLQNPTTGEIFYVGATQNSIKYRLRTHYQHLKECMDGNRKSNRKFEYMKKMLPTKATVHLLEVVHDGINLDEREVFYIKYFRKINPDLTNMTDGGRGVYTVKYYTEEEMEVYSKKISVGNKGKVRSESFKHNLSVSRFGTDNPAVKHLRCGWLVAFLDSKPIKLFKHGFEINNFLHKKSGADSNVLRQYTTGNPYGFNWKLFEQCDKEIQDIVQSDYESNQRSAGINL